MTVIVDARPTELVLVNQTERIGINVRNAAGTAVDVDRPGGVLSLNITALNDTVVVADDWVNDPGGTSIINSGVGRYYYPYGSGVPAGNTNGSLGDFLFRWRVGLTASSEVSNVIQVARVVSAMTMSLLPDFRLRIDKSAKLVDEDPDDPCFLGYTDSNLVSFLQGGLSIINGYQPYPLWSSIDNFPTQWFKEVLFQAGLMAGVMSQELYATDTDIDAWSDQGNVMTISHQPKLAAFLNTLSARLDNTIPKMKLHAINSGSVRVEAGPNYRLAHLVAAAPTGSLFRNIFFAG